MIPLRQALCLLLHCTEYQAPRPLLADLQSGWVELNWLCDPILRSPLFVSCVPPIFSYPRKEMYTSTSPITINFEIITQCLTKHGPCDIIPDYKAPSANWFVRKSIFNAWHAPKGSQGLLREERQQWTLMSGNHSCLPVWDRAVLARKPSWLWIWSCPWWSYSQMATLNAAFIALRHFSSS